MSKLEATLMLNEQNHNLTIFTGRFGGGKTEIAINYALWLRDEHEKMPYLIDLDIVTPYFRTRETTEILAERGVEVIAPHAVGQHLDTPAISPRILGVIQQTARPVVLDVGGDRQGARALGQYSRVFIEKGYEMAFVINPNRPFTDTVEGIEESVREIELSSHLQATALVSNPNLIDETTPELVIEGHKLIERAALIMELPLAFLAIAESIYMQMDLTRFDQPILPLKRHFVLPWA